eukprot:1032293-Pelagomonas_calceolata.AAC.2
MGANRPLSRTEHLHVSNFQQISMGRYLGQKNMVGTLRAGTEVDLEPERADGHTKGGPAMGTTKIWEA